ncbi:MAG: hypothetical protein VX527_07340 [Planctomycetota bacterium]|nr:hypothetical protein [Planctomycetota bacterium]
MRSSARERRSLMPVIIIVVAFMILGWSQWSHRQSREAIANKIEILIFDLCAGNSPVSIRWGDPVIQDAVITSVQSLCDSPRENLSIVTVQGEDTEDPMIEVRIALENRNVMTLEVEEMPGGKLLVRGWSSE